MSDSNRNASRTWAYPWETPQGWFWMVSYAAAVIVGLALPPDVLDKVDGARAFVATMASWNPQISKLGEMNLPTSKSNQLLYAILWCVMPIYWALFARYVYINQKPEFKFTAESPAELLALVAGFALLLYGAMHLIGDPTGRIGKSLFGSLITRSLWAPGIVFIVGVYFLVPVTVVLTMVMGRVDYRNKQRGSRAQ